MSYASFVDDTPWSELRRPRDYGGLNGLMGSGVWRGAKRGREVDAAQNRAASLFQQVSSPTLALLSPQIKGAERFSRLHEAFLSAKAMSEESVAQGEAASPDRDTWSFAIIKLMLMMSTLDAPLLLPLQAGGLSAEWHDKGINLEMRFRRVNDVYVVIEDARAEIESYYGPDPTFGRTMPAAIALSHRLR